MDSFPGGFSIDAKFKVQDAPPAISGAIALVSRVITPFIIYPLIFGHVQEPHNELLL